MFVISYLRALSKRNPLVLCRIQLIEVDDDSGNSVNVRQSSVIDVRTGAVKKNNPQNIGHNCLKMNTFQTCVKSR